MRVIIAAAGTGGHINPGLAIANKIKEEEPDSEIIFIGTPRGLENDLVPRAGYGLKKINAYGLSKKLSIDNLKKICSTISATGDAKKIIREFMPGPITIVLRKNSQLPEYINNGKETIAIRMATSNEIKILREGPISENEIIKALNKT